MSQLNKMPRFTLSQLVVLAICSFAFVHGDFVADLSDSPFVTPLSGKNFAETVVSTAQVNLVLYYTSDCGAPCQNLASIYLTAAENLKDVVQVRAVDCSEEDSMPICGFAEISQVPTIQIFKAYGEPEEVQGQQVIAKKPETYKGPVAAPSIAKWALSFLPNVIIPLDSKTLDPFMKMYLQIPRKEKPSTKLRALALHFDDRTALMFEGRKFMPIGLANTEHSPEIAAKFDVFESPSMVLVKANGDRIKYEGEFEFQAMFEFMDTHATLMTNEMRENLVKASQRNSAPPSPPPPLKPEVYHVQSQADFDRYCTRSGTCVIAFIDPSDTVFLDELKSLVEEKILTQGKYRTLRVMYVDGEAHPEFKSKFFVADSYPQLVAFQKSTLRVRHMRSAIDEPLLVEFLDKIVGVGFRGRHIAVLDELPSFDSQEKQDL